MIKRKRKLNKVKIVNRPKVMYVKSDVVDHPYLTRGKLYPTRLHGYFGDSDNLRVIDTDTGQPASVLLQGCAFLDGGSWDVVYK